MLFPISEHLGNKLVLLSHLSIVITHLPYQTNTTLVINQEMYSQSKPYTIHGKHAIIPKIQ